jgi:UDPglucose 6-dehydrogenase
MKITIFGTGYVGLVTGTCLAEVGHNVLCVDIDQNKVDALKNGIIPIYEPGLENLVLENTQSGQLNFTTDIADGVNYGDVIFIAVGTPPQEDGSADLQYVLSVAKSVGEHMQSPKIVVGKSTVPVGTCDKVRAKIAETLNARGVDIGFEVVSNPEFLKEGAAVNDFMKPDRIVIGCETEATRNVMRELYAPFNRNHERMVFMDTRSSEMTKYAANAMLATKISFMNEMANIAERVGADIEMVRHGIGSDPRIGYHFIYPGCGYGGSCFPKDVKALKQTADEIGYNAELLAAVEAVNQRQKSVLVEKVKRHFGNDLSGKTFALWGLAFKPQTDDMREASSLTIMEELWAAGAKVQAFDPVAMEETQHIIGKRDDLQLVGTKEAAINKADALIICTEWKNFRAPDFDEIKERLNNSVIFDGRNLYDPVQIKERGFHYYAIGRGDSIQR